MWVSPAGFASVSLSDFGACVLPNRRLPSPSTTGNTISRSSSTRSFSTSSVTSCALPFTRTSVTSVRAAVHEDVTLVLVAELRHLAREIGDHVRVVPRRVRKRRRHHVLGHAVELVGEFALARRPRLREPLVGRAAQQQRFARHDLVELELVAVGAAVVLERPTAAVPVLGTARVLDHTIYRHELRHHDLRHLSVLLVVRLQIQTPPRPETRRSGRQEEATAEPG